MGWTSMEGRVSGLMVMGCGNWPAPTNKPIALDPDMLLAMDEQPIYHHSSQIKTEI